MRIITDINDYIPVPCAATIGSFDGVHLGHRAMLDELRVRAAEKALPLMVVTFAHHPRLLFNAGGEPFLLSGNETRQELLAAAGVDILVMLDFDASMASMSAGQFMQDILVARLGVKLLAVGYDHHFGKPCKGEGLSNYIEYGNRSGVDVFGTSPFSIDGEMVSSSAVRRALAAGDVVKAGTLLGYTYRVVGCVVHCAGIGRTIGFPTANLQPLDNMQMFPANGVYEVAVTVGAIAYKGVMNVGVKPTVSNGNEPTAEVHIIGFSGDIYGTVICVEFLRYLRGERRFGNLDELRQQITADVERVKTGK